MSAPERWDLLVLGGGTAGIVAAKTVARFGAQVLLVERDRTGGDLSVDRVRAVLGVRRAVETSAVPRVTCTHPEVAGVGVDTGRERDGIRILTLAHRHVDRAVTEDLTDGLTRLDIDGKGRILGATVVGPRAGETLDGPWNAAIADVREQLDRPGTRRALHTLARTRRTLARTRRWWLERRAA